MIEIKLEETTSLSLNMKLDGDVAGTPEVRFSILSEGVRYSFNAVAAGHDEFVIEFPILEGKLAAGVYDAEVEIVVDNRHFTPLQESVKLTKSLKPTVKLAEQMKKVEMPSASIRIGAAKVVRPINDAKALLESVKVGEDIDSTAMLVGLTKLVEGSKLSEKEALASLKMIEFYGTDIANLPTIAPLVNLSERVRDELGSVLRDKGISTRRLKDVGIL